MSRNKEFKCLWVNYFCGCLSTQSAWFFPGDDYWDISHGKDVTAIEKLGVYIQITLYKTESGRCFATEQSLDYFIIDEKLYGNNQQWKQAEVFSVLLLNSLQESQWVLKVI